MPTTIQPKVSRPFRGLELVPFHLQALLTFIAVSPTAPVATFSTRGFLAPNGLLQNAFGAIYTLADCWPPRHKNKSTFRNQNCPKSKTDCQASSWCLLNRIKPENFPEHFVLHFLTRVCESSARDFCVLLLRISKVKCDWSIRPDVTEIVSRLEFADRIFRRRQATAGNRSAFAGYQTFKWMHSIKFIVSLLAKHWTYQTLNECINAVVNVVILPIEKYKSARGRCWIFFAAKNGLTVKLSMSNSIKVKTTFVGDYTTYKTLTERVNTFVVILPNDF